MNYKLSGKNENRKSEYEEEIAEDEQRYTKLYGEIETLRKGQQGNLSERNLTIEEKELQLAEIDRSTVLKEQKIARLYVIEMKDILNQKKQNNEISTEDYENEAKNIDEYMFMLTSQNAIEDCYNRNSILDMRTRLLYKKKSLNEISKEEADENIASAQEKKSYNEDYIQKGEDSLKKREFEYIKRNLYYQRDSGKISDEELQQKESELTQQIESTSAEGMLDQIFSDLATKYLQEEKEQTTDSAENSHTYQELMSRLNPQLGEAYAKGFDGPKAELAYQFAVLNGNNSNLSLSQFEKVDGLNIESLENSNIGFDTSALHGDIFVATYDDSDYEKGSEKPTKQYYRKNENGEFELIGEASSNGYTKLLVNGFNLTLKNDQVEQGNTTEKVTQQELDSKLWKEKIESSLNDKKLTGATRIEDFDFLESFANQTGNDISELMGSTFLVSTLDKEGNEDFDIVFQDENGSFSSLNGVDFGEKNYKETYIPTGRKAASGDLEETTQERTLNERKFVTKDGHTYTITRNEYGELGFNEILKESNNMKAFKNLHGVLENQLVTDNLVQAYDENEIADGDLKKAYRTIEKTKAEREQNQYPDKRDNFEGR